MNVRTLFVLALAYLGISCGLPPEYIIREELYPKAVGYSTTTEDQYTLFRINNQEELVGYLLSIKTAEGILFLKASPACVLETALLYQNQSDEAKRFPVYQSDWNQSLRQLAERPNLHAIVTHFLTNHYQADLQPKRGSALSIF